MKSYWRTWKKGEMYCVCGKSTTILCLRGHCIFAVSTSLFRSNNGMEMLPTYRSIEFKTDISERLSQNIVTLNSLPSFENLTTKCFAL